MLALWLLCGRSMQVSCARGCDHWRPKVKALQAVLGAAAHCKRIANADIVLVVAINLEATVYGLTDNLHFPAEALSSPGIQLRITHIAFPHKVVKLIAVVGEYILA